MKPRVGTWPIGVSVVIPAFNRVGLLLRAIESVQSCGQENVEILVVDDASETDVRLSLPATNSSGVPVRSYRLVKNAGAQAARNMGVRRSRFRYIAFLDSDDAFSARKIARVLDEMADDRCDLLFHPVGGLGLYARIGRIWWMFRHLIPFPLLLAVLNPVPTPGLVIRKIRRLGVRGMRHAEDYAFLCRYVSRSTRVKFLDEQLSAVFREPGSTGGLSAATWKMRKGEFQARLLFARQGAVWGALLVVVGGIVGLLRILSDLLRGRYGFAE